MLNFIVICMTLLLDLKDHNLELFMLHAISADTLPQYHLLDHHFCSHEAMALCNFCCAMSSISYLNMDCSKAIAFYLTLHQCDTLPQYCLLDHFSQEAVSPCNFLYAISSTSYLILDCPKLFFLSSLFMKHYSSIMYSINLVWVSHLFHDITG